MDDHQLQQLKIWINESHQKNITEAMATWEHSRETISSKFILAIDAKVDEALVKMDEKMQKALQQNKELTFLRNIGSFWSVSGWLMKGVILFSAFTTAVVGVLVLINKVLHSVDK